jgi:hypothetical protein
MRLSGMLIIFNVIIKPFIPHHFHSNHRARIASVHSFGVGVVKI